jgi:SAM-dependent methyltransferase
MSLLLEDSKRISGTDIDEQAIRWLNANYSCFNDLDANGSMPPTKYPDATFDFIYSISVFTHLPEDMQHAWLKELRRILKPGGYGMFTFHGENHYHKLSEADRKELMEKGFSYSVGAATDGLPEFYQTTFHTHDYVKRVWSNYFEVIDIRKRWISDWQDAVLLRVKP